MNEPKKSTIELMEEIRTADDPHGTAIHLLDELTQNAAELTTEQDPMPAAYIVPNRSDRRRAAAKARRARREKAKKHDRA